MRKGKRINYTFIALVENKPGVLNRVASLFRRRNFNIESLAVGRTEKPDISRMTIVVDCPNGDVDAPRIEANLYKLVNVIERLRPVGVVEMVRTGQVAMMRGANSGIRRMPGANGNREEDYKMAQMTP